MSKTATPVALVADYRYLPTAANDNADSQRAERSARIRELEQSIRARLAR